MRFGAAKNCHISINTREQPQWREERAIAVAERSVYYIIMSLYSLLMQPVSSYIGTICPPGRVTR